MMNILTKFSFILCYKNPHWDRECIAPIGNAKVKQPDI